MTRFRSQQGPSDSTTQHGALVRTKLGGVKAMSIRLTFLLMSGTFPKLTSLTAISFLVPRFMPRITSPKVPLPRLFLRFHRIGWLSPTPAVSDLYD